MADDQLKNVISFSLYGSDLMYVQGPYFVHIEYAIEALHASFFSPDLHTWYEV